MTTRTLAPVERYTVQDIPDMETVPLQSHLDYFFGLTGGMTSQFVPSWGQPSRQQALRRLAYKDDNTLPMGAIHNLITRVVQTPYQLTGGKNNTSYWSQLFMYADFNAGYEDFMSKVLFDYLTLDLGAFVEIIAPGQPDTPISGRVVGVAHLDALKCYPTGVPEFPVVYMDTVGKTHKLHWTRVYRMVDSPSPERERRGLGRSALGRVVSLVQTYMYLSRYQNENLSDLPPKGILSVSGISQRQFDDMQVQFETDRTHAGQFVFRNIMRLHAADPSLPVDIKMFPFSTLPEHFSYLEMLQTLVNILAVGLGEDPQEIWPLTGQAMGTGAQSSILHAKGKAKTYGALMQKIGRFFNNGVLPPNMEFKFHPKDEGESIEAANIADRWSLLVDRSMRTETLTRNESRQLLANTVPAFADILLDEQGVLVLADDEQEQDVQPDATVTEAQTEATPEAESDSTQVEATRTAAQRDIQATRLDYEDSAFDIIRAFSDGTSNRRQFSIRFRALNSRSIARAYSDGLERGGVNAIDISAEDRAEIASLVTQSSTHVTSLGAAIKDSDTPLTDDQIWSKVSQWWNKSINPAFLAGIASADKNGYYRWNLGSTEEHCADCRKLDGQIHRMRDYVKSGWLPQADQLECGGFQCKCTLTRADNARATGRFPR